MGVPSFYRWLTNKYPNVVVKAIEAKQDSESESIDTTLPNPNGIEFDNLYLDMNGIIHPCFHPDDHAAEEDRLRRKFEMEGKPVLPKCESEVSDSNIITPGTDFMYQLSKALRSYISARINNDPGWRNIKGVLQEQQQQPIGESALETSLNSESGSEKPGGLFNSSNIVKKSASLAKKPYGFLHIWILRECLELDMKISDPPENLKIDLERIVDDFVFMCFFVGNDFLPHMPTLEIHEGAIDLLMFVYLKEFKNLGGYLIDMSQPAEDKRAGYLKLSRVEKFILLVGSYEEKIFMKRLELRERNLKRFCYNNSDDQEDNEDGNLKRKLLGTVLVWHSVKKHQLSDLSVLILLKFYPYHYGPFASDLKGLAQVKGKFKKGCPFKPFDQLLSVLPPMSAHALPKVYQALMMDEESSIIDFYPTDLDIDTDGKRFMWQGICKLPFIEEGRLLSETKELEKDLSEVEAMRNRNSVDHLYVSSRHKLASQVLSLSPKQNESVKIDTSLRLVNPCASDGIGGSIRRLNQHTEMVQDDVYYKIEENCVLCVSFEMLDGDAHVPRLLDGVVIPDKTVTEDDILKTELWHKYPGNRPPYRLQQQGCRKADDSPDSAHEGYSRRFLSDTSSEVIHKNAGRGWGTGRGKINDSSNIESTIGRIQLKDGERIMLPNSSFIEKKSTGSSWDARKSYNHPVRSIGNLNNRSSNYNGTCASNQMWKPVGTDMGEIEGFKELKISGSSQGFRPNGRAQLVNKNFWHSRDGATYDTNNAWQHNIKAGATPSNDQRRGNHGSTDNMPNSGKHSSNNNLMQGFGRGRNVPSSSDSESSNRW
uniref:Uncharacterized protein n=1 Tax=Fagus sylvatica TaxID=28930 RepID=A0A2N9HEK2_FAGSY